MKTVKKSIIPFIIGLICLCPPFAVIAETKYEIHLKTIDRSIRLREYSLAVEQLQPLLKQNIAKAQFLMGGLYRSGLGVPKNMEKAITEYRKASQNGLDVAQFTLASLLEKRGSTNQQISEIRLWYKAAAKQGHRKAIKKLASLENRKSNKNLINISKKNIFSAIRNNALNQIQAYIENGVNFNIIDNRQRTPLMVSLLSGHSEMSSLLLPVSTGLDNPDINNDRPLHIATTNGFSRLVKALIQHKVDINALDSQGNTALIIATRHDDNNIMALLLDNHADHRIRNKKNQTAAQLAQTHDLKQAKLIFQQYAIKLPEKNRDFSQLDINTFKSSISSASSLYKGWPLINIASMLGELAIISQLLDQGADINATDSMGNTALHRAAGKGQLKTVKLLISRGSNINAVNSNNQTALYIAASTGQIKTIQYLIKKSADSSVIANSKNSALSIAILNQHAESALALVSEKLDNSSIHSALFIALKKHMEAVSTHLIKRDKLLIFSDSKNRSALWHSADNGLIKATTALLNKNQLDINSSDINGYTALARAIQKRHTEIVQLLIKYDASMNTITREGNSILMLSVIADQTNIFNKILQLSTTINTKNKAGDTALMLAAGNGNNAFVKQLINAGSDIQTRNQDDLNAYQVAINSGHKSTAKLIRDNSGKLFKFFN